MYSGGEQLKKKLILIGIAILVVLLTTWTIWGNVTVGITHYTVLSEKIPAAFNHYRNTLQLSQDIYRSGAEESASETKVHCVHEPDL